jgi:hypothetical protein
MSKICACCKKTKEVKDFWKRARAKDGYASSCMECIRDQNHRSYKNHWAKNRTRIDSNHYKFLEEMRGKCNQLKHIAGCHFCRESEPICLDFHHRDPKEKEYLISSMIVTHKTWEQIQSEIGKCIVVCANCHRKIHSGILTLECT